VEMWWRVPLRSEKAYASQQTIATMLNPEAVTITTYDLPQRTACGNSNTVDLSSSSSSSSSFIAPSQNIQNNKTNEI